MSETPEEYLREMLESGERIERLRQHEAIQTSEIIELNQRMVQIQENRNTILEEILAEIRRLRITGIQP